ncbi:MAG: tRNA dihydrouridine synthase DusB [Stygiobacter sp. RIFOXYC12_FULL_38_8]|nr:MAG: tRNA dihydrouridine synthase DusB [Stygiobacter sp. GWC2_38_9]OGV09457.1 MAG: tRNA dihydrouridine synthase DusB [Stygiobacter sp. RIFOXYB2_FULL_37_11]OGV11341.1 MAG: tRNA dihydrouridine synthase DusB [Stygiobacter sp. RIFOXYA2_FULL_38_8]OGV15315.1 MAG: tRNA dihydrouridine synthase DusB [Stygiobacter sp. RIFOXYC2_FULL_38_25]OGV30147.1 MAG: tRNA dihydrouridine synthase DusB [Stygiobacter sp. RIFOXYC12_FULL_38_8]OGV79053.1 MAG: tRNA dihydrouridine synthase DusB [Stygiobacter sp. GWF2_38_2
MFKVGKINIDKALLLAPMEDVTDIAYRRLCKELGADVVYTEFVNSDGLIRSNKKTEKKLEITDEERPVGIQIYGGNLEPMIEAAKIAETRNPEVIDINAGCWVKKIAGRGAGAGLLKDVCYLQTMVEEIVKSVSIPVTVKTRIGWDANSINILDVAKRIEDAGAAELTVHCRTRTQGHSGDADWNWIPKVKEVVKIPVALNGGIFTAEDVKRAFDETNADAVMIARGAIDHPWIFREAKQLLNGETVHQVTPEERIATALKHLKYSLEIRDVRGAIIPFRKYYAGYLKGLHGSKEVRQHLYQQLEYAPIEEILFKYLEELQNHEHLPNAVQGD